MAGTRDTCHNNPQRRLEGFWLHAKSSTHAPTEIWNSYGAGNRGKSPQLLPAEALPQRRTAVALCRFDCLSLPALPFLIRDAWNRDECFTRRYLVSQPIHAADGMQLVGFNVRPRRIHESVFNVNSNNVPPQDDPGVADLDGRVLAAFECGVFSARRGDRKRCEDF